MESMKIYASRSSEIEQRELDHMSLSRRVAAECVVLLENDGVLPISPCKVALYGNGARKTIKGGTGSGDVYVRSSVNVEEGLKNAGFEVLTISWLDKQDALIDKALKEYLLWSEEEGKKTNRPAFSVQFDHPYYDKTQATVEDDDICKDADTAIYVIARNSGEGSDRYTVPGDYYLLDEEKKNIERVAREYKKTIVVLNVGGIVDTKAIKEIPGVNALVLMGQLGNVGGDALADVLCGKVNPSGKTTDTWAKEYMDYPSSEKFSHNESVDDEMYEDGIFMGYRYFDSFKVAPAYPFGYGKSYTDFDISVIDFSVNGGIVSLDVNVKNIGDKYAGKEVVQVYYSAPDGELIKPVKELVAYKKTAMIEPGMSDNLTLQFEISDMASYSEEKATWILEKGDYVILVGSSSADNKAVGVLSLDEDAVTIQCKNLFKLDRELVEISPCEKPVIDSSVASKVNILAKSIQKKTVNYSGERIELVNNKDEILSIKDVISGNCSVEDLVAQLSIEEMAELCVGTMRMNGDGAVGNFSYLVPGAAADSSSVIKESRGVKNMILADGPAGLRLQPHFKTDLDGNILPGGEQFGDNINGFDEKYNESNSIDYYQYCTAIPIGWSLAMSWNEPAVEELGQMIGKEMEQFGVDLWLAPALNIHRNPLCGRNFEYYSEDPLVAGKVTAAMTIGVQSVRGRGTTIKHFAVNNQEDNRYFVNAHVGERALREIYLKGFEIAVRDSQPLSIMTSYNLLNGIHTANNIELIQYAARDEWGFDGVIMTDWFTSQDVPWITGKYEPKYPISASTGCIFAGNDLQMPGCEKNVQDIIDAVTTGKEIDGFKITKADLQYNAANIIKVIAKMA